MKKIIYYSCVSNWKRNIQITVEFNIIIGYNNNKNECNSRLSKFLKWLCYFYFRCINSRYELNNYLQKYKGNEKLIT